MEDGTHGPPGFDSVTCSEAVGHLLWCGHEDGSVTVRDPHNQSTVEVRQFRGQHSGTIAVPTSLLHIPEMEDVWIAYSDGRITVVSEHELEVLGSTNAHVGTVHHMVRHDGWVFSCSADTFIHRYSIFDEKPVRQITLEGHTQPVRGLCSTGSVLLSVAMDQSVRVWGCSDGSVVTVLSFAASNSEPQQELMARLQALSETVSGMEITELTKHYQHLLPDVMKVTSPARRRGTVSPGGGASPPLSAAEHRRLAMEATRRRLAASRSRSAERPASPPATWGVTRSPGQSMRRDRMEKWDSERRQQAAAEKKVQRTPAPGKGGGAPPRCSSAGGGGGAQRRALPTVTPARRRNSTATPPQPGRRPGSTSVAARTSAAIASIAKKTVSVVEAPRRPARRVSAPSTASRDPSPKLRPSALRSGSGGSSGSSGRGSTASAAPRRRVSAPSPQGTATRLSSAAAAAARRQQGGRAPGAAAAAPQQPQQGYVAQPMPVQSVAPAAAAAAAAGAVRHSPPRRSPSPLQQAAAAAAAGVAAQPGLSEEERAEIYRRVRLRSRGPRDAWRLLFRVEVRLVRTRFRTWLHYCQYHSMHTGRSRDPRVKAALLMRGVSLAGILYRYLETWKLYTAACLGLVGPGAGGVGEQQQQQLFRFGDPEPPSTATDASEAPEQLDVEIPIPDRSALTLVLDSGCILNLSVPRLYRGADVLLRVCKAVRVNLVVWVPAVDDALVAALRMGDPERAISNCVVRPPRSAISITNEDTSRMLFAQPVSNPAPASANTVCLNEDSEEALCASLTRLAEIVESIHSLPTSVSVSLVQYLGRMPSPVHIL